MRYSTLSFLKSEWGEEMGNIRDLKKFEEIAKYQFRDFGLLRQAVTHSSYANEKRLGKNKCNERLEFLGDAVLELISSEFLYGLYPDVPEGELTKKRASMVCEPSLAMSARDIQLPDFLLLGKGEEYTGGRERDSITSDALEAVIGAIYLMGVLNVPRILSCVSSSMTWTTNPCSTTARLSCRRSSRTRGRSRNMYSPGVQAPIMISGFLQKSISAERSTEREKGIPRKRRNRWRHTRVF